MGAYRVARDSKAQPHPGAVGVAAFIQAIERAEGLLARVGGNARPVIIDTDIGARPVTFRRQRHGLGVSRRVLHQIGEGAFQRVLAAVHGEPVFKVELEIDAFARRIVGEAFAQRGKVDVRRLLAGLAPGDTADRFEAAGTQVEHHRRFTSEAVVVVGGASLILLGLATRTTDDVDVIASARRSEPSGAVMLYPPPSPLPEALRSAIAVVARDFGLPTDWMNVEISAQWSQGLPPGLPDDITWRRYSGLDVGLAGRKTLIALKLFASVDQGQQSVHFQDLLLLGPSEEELLHAAEWVKTQDAAPEFPQIIQQVVHYALEKLR